MGSPSLLVFTGYWDPTIFDYTDLLICINKHIFDKSISQSNIIYTIFQVPIKDKLPCKESGMYHIWFSNEHAWIHSLEVKIRFEIV